jgi:hypothetical protein
MKNQLKAKICRLIERKNVEKLKDLIAHISWYEKIGHNKHIMYDSNMFVSNVDLRYVVSISDEGFAKIESDWYTTKQELLSNPLPL